MGMRLRTEMRGEAAMRIGGTRAAATELLTRIVRRGMRLQEMRRPERLLPGTQRREMPMPGTVVEMQMQIVAGMPMLMRRGAGQLNHRGGWRRRINRTGRRAILRR